MPGLQLHPRSRKPSKNDTPATEQTPSTSTEQTEQTAPAEDVVYKDELHVGYNLEPATLDPMMVADAPVRVVTYGNIYEALVTLDAEFNVKPELCESYEVNNDGREYLYHLRTGIKFHNGEEMTADDVVASMNRWIEHYGNAQNTVGESRFEKVDDSTVKIVFDGPIAFFNELIATQSQGSVIMPKSVIENVDASTGEVQEYIGTGPYKFVEWKSGTYIKLEKFEDYSPYGVEGEASGWYGYKTQATPVIYYDIVSDNATRAAGIQTGEYDIVTEMGGRRLCDARQHRGFDHLHRAERRICRRLQQGRGPLRGCQHASGDQRDPRCQRDPARRIQHARLLP